MTLTNTTPAIDSIVPLLSVIVSRPDLHARWLNTLSYLENCGARMIASCEHPTMVREEMLKHAAEEFRHAYHLKKQIGKVTRHKIKDYTNATLLGGAQSKHYLYLLNASICRYLSRERCLETSSLKACAYLLVTYAIERRASILYPLYQQVLSATGSNVSMRFIIAEEEAHLAEIEQGLEAYSDKEFLKRLSLSIEHQLFNNLIKKLGDINFY